MWITSTLSAQDLETLTDQVAKMQNGGRPALGAGDPIIGPTVVPRQSTVFVP